MCFLYLGSSKKLKVDLGLKINVKNVLLLLDKVQARVRLSKKE